MDDAQLVARVLAGGGEMGARMRALDWSCTPVGPVERWPQSLRTAVSLLLNSRFPMMLHWGPELTQFYNDAYAPSLGSKHPGGLGQAARLWWPEIWDVLEPMFERVLAGEATWYANQLFTPNRRGFLEEAYFTLSHSPIRDESGGVGGIFLAVTETTGQVVGERRLRALKELSEANASPPSAEEACRQAARVLEKHRHDVTFARFYLTDAPGAVPRLVASVGPSEPAADDAGRWSLEPVLRGGEASTLTDVQSRVGLLSGGPWPEAPHSARVLPLGETGARAGGALVVGLSPRRPLDAEYLDFLGLVAAQVTTALASAHRREAAAALERAKTDFFSNVSHELRTPLTLLLGPLQDALVDTSLPLPEAQRERVNWAWRGAQRLLKLVNTLLDFSRLEAGRLHATPEWTDLSAMTADLARSFESLFRRTDVHLRVDCPPLPGPVWMDRESWEKIVLNLLSNAFKFTFEGEVRVALRWSGGGVELEVADTGTGIAEAELPRLFERFHQVRGAKGRSMEGSGIGLALVQELVRLHGGDIRVESVPGGGSTFRVRLPTRLAPVDSPRSLPGELSTRATAYLQEAEQWLGGALADPEETELPPPPDEAPRDHVLVVDDNADVRDYMTRLLQGRFRVEAVSDGRAALAAARARPPEVVVSDVMMPGLNGFELVRELKADARTAHVPIMLISARASEQATLEGFEAGSIDYLVKPFRARELVARTEAIVKAARAQAESRRLLREVEAARGRLSGLIDHSPAFVAALAGPQHVFQLANPPYQQLVGEGRALLGRPVQEALPELVEQGFVRLLDGVYRTREPFIGREMPIQLKRRVGGALENAFVNFVYQPRYDAQGQVEGIDVFGFEVTEQVQARELLRERVDFEQKLLGIVSHDLRNPLSAILLGTSLMARREGLDARTTQSLVRIQSAAERAVRMVKDLLDFTQARLGGGLKIAPRPMDLHQVVRGVVEEVEVVYPTRVVEVKQEGDGQGDWDADRMAQVMQNLLTNALKYSPEDSRVQVTTRAVAEQVVLSVANRGPPIPEDKLVSIFEPMQRATEELDKVGRSVGLGLYIVKSIVAAHGGRITVSSTEAQGTVFTLSLPRQRT